MIPFADERGRFSRSLQSINLSDRGFHFMDILLKKRPRGNKLARAVLGKEEQVQDSAVNVESPGCDRSFPSAEGYPGAIAAWGRCPPGVRRSL